MIRSVGQTRLYELLSSENNVVYEIPAYQREYSWGKEQWDALFDDLLDEPDNSGHFLGSIICINKTTDTTSQSVLELVDGQQRMTTLSLLLLAVYSRLRPLESAFDDDQKADFTNLKRMICLRQPARQRITLQKQNNNFDDYLYLLAGEGFDLEAPKVSYVGVRRISKAFQHFLSRLDQLLNGLNLDDDKSESKALFSFFNRVKQSVLVKLEVENHTDAFVLFESLNNRGLPLTPIDLIKTNLLSTADKIPGLGIDLAYKTWAKWLEELGDDYGNQERFFRQFYNAFKTQWGLTQPSVSVATRSKLIGIYEALISKDLKTFIDQMNLATSAYGQILGNRQIDQNNNQGFDEGVKELPRAQGVPAFMLLLFLSVNSEDLGFDDKKMVEVTDFLVRFFVRRNLTNTPPTYDLDRIFIGIIDKLLEHKATDESALKIIRRELGSVSANDEQFLAQLKGPIYDENVAVTRYVLIALAKGKTVEAIKTSDLWAQTSSGEKKSTYVWTIEHILPQGANLPDEWIQMLGGKDEASRIQREYVHTLGNLTISGYNSTLGNKSFIEKRDRTDNSKNFVGYKNGLSLNEDLAKMDSWGEQAILERTEKLSSRLLVEFSLS
jgi:hypothetical protein